MSGKYTLLVTKKMIVLAIVVVVAIVASIAVLATVNNNRVTTEATKTIDTPAYKTILPNNTSIDSLNGWTRISPTGNDPVYAYADSIKGIAISVSEQPLPASFKDTVQASTTELAKQYNATTQLDAGETKVYIGTSAKGPQSVIFVKDSLLILIKSQQKIENSDWKKYIESLK